MNTAQQLNLEKQRHSLAHVLALAVKRLYPETKIGIGPVTDTGFYYEFDTEHKFTHEDLETIEDEMNKIISENLVFTNIVIPRDQALNTLLQLGETYKTELLNKIPDSEVSFYKTGEDFIDLCRGPHVKITGELDNFKLIRISESYWLNDTSRPKLQKITGVAFESRKKMEEFVENLQKLKDLKSIKIAEKLKLIDFTDESTNGLIWLRNGITLKRKITTLLEDSIAETKSTLLEEPFITNTPNLLKEKFPKFYKKTLGYELAENKGKLRYDPHAFLLSKIVNKGNTASYGTVTEYYLHSENVSTNKFKNLTDFPITTSAVKISSVNENELKPKLIEEIKMIGKVLKALGFNQFKLIIDLPDYSKLDNYLYKESNWDKNITILKDIVNEIKISSVIREGGAEFYGPKYTFEIKDKYARRWETSSIVIDNILPSGLTGIDSQDRGIYYIHTSIIESIEKMLDIILEHGEGSFPLWMEPEQVEIIALESKYNHKATKVSRDLIEAGLRVTFENTIDSPDKLINSAIDRKTPYIILIGEKETETDSVSVKVNGQDIGLMRLNEFIKKLKAQIDDELDS
jgi:threonyl-tRNA synthetase